MELRVSAFHITQLVVPCGEVKNISNSENWKNVFGKDPTTGVYGLKIDDISGFGEQRCRQLYSKIHVVFR